MHPRSFMSAAILLLLPAAVMAQPLTFSRVDAASSAGGRGIAAADFDRNGWPDVAHANGSSNTVTIVLNAAGRLARAHDVATGRGPFDLAAADFNRDGTIDVAVANADDDTVTVLWGRGDGTFSTTSIHAPRSPRGIAAGDLNGDGWVDLAVTGFFDRSVVTLFGGAEGFDGGSRFALSGYQPQGIAAGDVNHDGLVDLAIAHESGSAVSVLYGRRPFGFVERVLGGPSSMNAIVIADVDANGWVDLAAASTASSRVAVYLGSAGGHMYAGSFATAASPRDVAAADVNLDGRLDLITADRDASRITILPGSGGTPLFGAALRFSAGAGSRALAVADFNHDGLPDVATANQSAASVTLLSNTTLFEPAANVFTSARVGTPSNLVGGGQVFVADFDHDGSADVATQAPDQAGVSVILGSGAIVTLGASQYVRSFWVRDLNRDGHDDVFVVVDFWASLTRTYLGDGEGGFTPIDAGLVPGSWRGIELDDVNGDGIADLVFGYADWPASYGIAAALGRGDGTFEEPVGSPNDSEVILSGVADMDRDGRLDAIVRRYPSDELEVLAGDGTGGFAAGQRIPVSLGSGFYQARAGDLNHDGFTDVVVGGGYAAGVLLGGAAGFSWHGTAIEVGFDEWLSDPTLADVDVDGQLDIVFAAAFIAFGNGDGSFRPLRFQYEGSAVAVADYTRDGLPDILHADTIGSVTVFVNQRHAGNRAPTVSAGADFTITYQDQFQEEGYTHVAAATDEDLHGVTYEWRDADGQVISTSRRVQIFSPYKVPGTYRLTVAASDGRGGTAVDEVAITIAPLEEIVLHAVQGWAPGWNQVADPSAASGYRIYDPNRHAPKVPAPLASPERHVGIVFIADPTQTYKLWVRLKANENSYSNDSVWVQVTGAVDAGGRSYAPDTTSGLAVNLEECAACGVSGWGWEDDGWGAPDTDGVLLRFPEGGYQVFRIQTREDGVSIDQVVLSSKKYLTDRPGAAKNDATILPFTYWFD